MGIEQRILEQSWEQAVGEGEYDEARRIALLAQKTDVEVSIQNLKEALDDAPVDSIVENNDADYAEETLAYIDRLFGEIGMDSEVPESLLSQLRDVTSRLEVVMGSGIRSSPLPDASEHHA